MTEEEKTLQEMKKKLEQACDAQIEIAREEQEAEREKAKNKKAGTDMEKSTGKKAVKKTDKNAEESIENKQGRNTKKSEEYSENGQKVIYIVEEYQDSEKEIKKKKSSKKNKEELPEELPKKRKKKRKKKHFLLKLILVIVLLVFGIHGLLMMFVSGTDYRPYESTYVRAEDVMHDPFVTNILIVGTDARNSDSSSRSDCMIILSLNRKKGEMVMTSILRDSYVSIPGHGMNRINAAFQYGGADLLIQTIEENFKIGIDAYIKLDFFSFINIIDAIGGVEIDVDGDEAQYVNMYLCEINNLLGVEQGNGNLTVTGMQNLSGKQALSYSRIRYIGTDFARTSRQREVMNAVLKKVKTLNPLKLFEVAKMVLPELTTDISDSDMAWLLMQAPLFLTYESSECRIPADHTWSNYVAGAGMEVLQLDFAANIEVLREAIY